MKLVNYPQAAGFLDVALEPLLREEEKNNLILGIAQRVRDGGRYGEDPPLFITVHDGARLAAAAIRTPPHNMILACEPDCLPALDVIADHLIDIGHLLPGAAGTVDVVTAFCRAWTARTGRPSSLLMAQRIYSLTEVSAPAGVPGTMRWAEEGDVELLANWFAGFHRDAVPGDPPTDPRENVRRFLRAGKLAVWQDGRPVSMTGSSRGTPNGATVSAVYTPPEFRRRGYASACVAALSQFLLDAGNRFCTLYTDLANPTSNKIYQQVGYRPVADCAMYTFENAAD